MPHWIPHDEPKEVVLGFKPVCEQENYEIIPVFPFRAERIKVGGMIGWDIHLFLYSNLCTLFKSMHENGQMIKSLFT